MQGFGPEGIHTIIDVELGLGSVKFPFTFAGYSFVRSSGHVLKKQTPEHISSSVGVSELTVGDIHWQKLTRTLVLSSSRMGKEIE